jgi:hydroxymethylpyrimidine pyrophosphatase-like HAD family hydrolase|tara:strand:+ start:1101 stop:1445 length:345 start_codon:yes stop_codon:yes gene_type:complete
MTTLFIDIDGTLLKHQGTFSDICMKEATLLPNVREKMNEWCSKEYKIILTTARRESMRRETERQLSKLGVPYDTLVMGISKGRRIIINDRRPNGDKTAFAVNVGRDHGLGDADL